MDLASKVLPQLWLPQVSLLTPKGFWKLFLTWLRVVGQGVVTAMTFVCPYVLFVCRRSKVCA